MKVQLVNPSDALTGAVVTAGFHRTRMQPVERQDLHDAVRADVTHTARAEEYKTLTERVIAFLDRSPTLMSRKHAAATGHQSAPSE
jgi:hypothetical protein